GDDADRNSVEPRIAADHLAREMLLELIDLSIVDDRAEQRVHVVRHAVVRGKQIIQIGNREWGIASRTVDSLLPRSDSRTRKALDQVSQLRQACLVALTRVVRDATDLGMRDRAA